MEIIQTEDINKVRREIDSLKSKNKKIAVLSQTDEFNRKILENKKVDIFILNEELNKTDYLKQRNSSLNEILCKLAKENNIQIAIDIEKIIQKKEKEQAKSLSRLIQNLMLCKKTKTEIILINAEKYDKRFILSLLLILKATTKQAKEIIKQSF